MTRSQTPSHLRLRVGTGLGRTVAVAVVLGLAAAAPARAQTAGDGGTPPSAAGGAATAPATAGAATAAAGESGSVTVVIGGLRMTAASGNWVRPVGAAAVSCVAPDCAGAAMTVAIVDEACGDELLRRRIRAARLAERRAPSDLVGQGVDFRVAVVASPCRSLSGDTLVACTTVGGQTRLVEVAATGDHHCSLPTSTAAAAEALLATARPDAR